MNCAKIKINGIYMHACLLVSFILEKLKERVQLCLLHRVRINHLTGVQECLMSYALKPKEPISLGFNLKLLNHIIMPNKMLIQKELSRLAAALQPGSKSESFLTSAPYSPIVQRKLVWNFYDNSVNLEFACLNSSMVPRFIHKHSLL